MLRPRLFIGSATPRLRTAQTLQARLEADFEVTVWDQNVFRPSGYPLPNLLERCRATDFAIFVLGPDVIQREASGAEVFAPNPNVLIEIGLFMGALAQERVIIVAPSTFKKIKMPSDLEGLTIVPYDAERADNNLDAALGSAAHKISTEFLRQWPNVLKARLPWHKVKMFQDFNEEFQLLVRNTSTFQSCYIHSRRWRENFGDILRSRMTSGELKSVVFYLPDVRNEQFIRALASRFDDGPSIPAMLLDAYRWADSFVSAFDSRATLRVYDRIPVYSFYLFDTAAIIAFYTLAIVRKSVPTIEAHKDDDVYAFLLRDLADFEKECPKLPTNQVKQTADAFAKRLGL